MAPKVQKEHWLPAFSAGLLLVSLLCQPSLRLALRRRAISALQKGRRALGVRQELGGVDELAGAGEGHGELFLKICADG